MVSQWQSMKTSWPSSLKSLWFQGPYSIGDLSFDYDKDDVKAPQIESLRLEDYRCDRDRLIYLNLMALFPNLRFLSVPLFAALDMRTFGVLRRSGRLLERFEIQRGTGDANLDILTKFLLDAMEDYPRLYQIKLHVKCMGFEPMWGEWEDIEALLERRAEEQDQVAGHTTGGAGNAGIILFED